MPSLNKVMLIGNAGRDAELRYLANGTAQASFSLAVNRRIPPQDGGADWRDETEWFNVVAWRDLAERISQTVTKGKQIYVEGRLQSRSWDNDQGVKQTRIEVIANTILLLGRNEAGPGGGGGAGWGDGAPAAAAPANGGTSAGSWSGGNRGQARPASAPRGGGAAGGGGWGGGAPGGDIDPDDLPFE